MNNTLKTIIVYALAAGVGVGAFYAFVYLSSTASVPTVEAVDADDLAAGRYHQRTHTNDFFRRGRG